MARKTYQGVSNDKGRSIQKLIEAVGTIIKSKGFTGLTATNIASAAGLNRKLITLYFGTVDHLFETYVRGKDYWLAASGETGGLIKENKGENTKDISEYLLHNQLEHPGNAKDNPCLRSNIDQAYFNGNQIIRDTDLLILKK